MPEIPMRPTVGATPMKATLWVPAAVHRVATLPPVASYGKVLGHGVEVGETGEESGDASLVWHGSAGWSAMLRSR
jgi:hypothetical protein